MSYCASLDVVAISGGVKRQLGTLLNQIKLKVMDSILEMDSQEIQAVKQALMADHKELFREHAESLFYDCFLMITSTGAKTENFQLLRSLSE